MFFDFNRLRWLHVIWFGSLTLLWHSLMFLCVIDFLWNSLMLIHGSFSIFDCLAVRETYVFLCSSSWNLAIWGASMRMGQPSWGQGRWLMASGKRALSNKNLLAGQSLFLFYGAWGLVWGSVGMAMAMVRSHGQRGVFFNKGVKGGEWGTPRNHINPFTLVGGHYPA